MAQLQGATPPAWLGRSRLDLLRAACGGLRQNWDKLVQLAGLVAALFRPALVRRRLERLRAAGHVDANATLSQLLVAARDQMIVSAAAETRLFYRAQGIPWVFHNLRRLISGPATMLDPMGLFSPRDAIVHHVLQTFHRHPVYDLVLLEAHEGGVDELERQVGQLLRGSHPHQSALDSLVEDGSYHRRLPLEIATFRSDPRAPARPVPAGLVDDPYLMVGMDQFKDLAGYVRYASRLPATRVGALRAWLGVAWDESLGGLFGWRVGPRRVCVEACDPEIASRHLA